MATSHGSASLVESIAAQVVAPGHVTAWWLGGSGFVFKTPGGTQIYIDPYLSDIVRDIFGSARAFPPPIAADQARPDIVISSHWHEDHLDPGAIPVIAQHSPTTRFIMPPSATAHALSWSVPRNRVSALSVGESIGVGDVTITAVPAATQPVSPAGTYLTPSESSSPLAGLKLYHTPATLNMTCAYGGSEPRVSTPSWRALMASPANTNAHEAALLAGPGAGTVIPSIHHLLWAGDSTDEEATLDPKLFAETYRKLGGTGRVVIPEIGAPIAFSRGSRTSQ